MSVAFFDLDRTLLDVNSGHLWVVNEWKVGQVTVTETALAVYWLVRYALGDDTMEHALDRATAVYAGQPEAALRARIEVWFDRTCAHRLRPGAREALQRHRAAGDRVVLATSTSQFAAARAAEVFGLDDIVSTRVEVRDGVVTGRIATYGIGVHKRDATAAWAKAHGVDLADCAFYTDSYSDLALLEAVGRPVIVSPDRRLRREAARRGWPVEDWGRA